MSKKIFLRALLGLIGLISLFLFLFSIANQWDFVPTGNKLIKKELLLSSRSIKGGLQYKDIYFREINVENAEEYDNIFSSISASSKVFPYFFDSEKNLEQKNEEWKEDIWEKSRWIVKEHEKVIVVLEYNYYRADKKCPNFLKGFSNVLYQEKKSFSLFVKD